MKIKEKYINLREHQSWKWKSLNGMINENTGNGNEKGRPKEVKERK